MSRLATSFVLGYHGCDRSTVEYAVNKGIHLLHSDKDFDWLGPGAYFWESDPRRALEWAHWKAKRGDYENPAVVGAVIDLRHYLDLVTREDLELLRFAHDSFVALRQKAHLPIPKNLSVPGKPNEDRVLRYLDCAVFKHLHELLETPAAKKALGVEAFDTVRGMFTEGGPLYAGAGFRKQSHVQIAVRNPDCIRGLFLPRPYPTWD